jgi:hypothetical protein
MWTTKIDERLRDALPKSTLGSGEYMFLLASENQTDQP